MSLLRPAAAVAFGGLLALAAVVVMFGYGGSWLSVIAGCALFALGVRLVESGIGFCLYGGRAFTLADPQETLRDP